MNMKIKTVLTTLPALVFCILSLLAVKAFGNGGDMSMVYGKDWVYYDFGDHISVCGYSGKEAEITIPEEIDGKPVTELLYGGKIISSIDSEAVENTFFNFKWIYETKTTTKLTVPSSVKSIGAYTFYGCTSLEQVELPEGLISVGEKAFAYCTGLTEAGLPKGLKSIGKNAYALTSVTLSKGLPEGLEYIGNAAFLGTNITRLEIPDTVKYIGQSAFYSCRQLESAKLSKGLTELSPWLFENCVKLKRAEIPEGTKVIGSSVFYGCISLEEIHIPSTVISVSDILYKNTSLKDISFDADRETVEALTGSDVLTRLMVEYDTETDYSGVQIHYGEKREEIAEDSRETNMRNIFKLLAITFAAALVFVLFLYVLQTFKSRPEAVTEGQGNIHSKYDSEEIRLCGKCGAESGKNANYCYNCGKKLTAKPPKGKGKEK